jgi:hypothetical protein
MNDAPEIPFVMVTYYRADGSVWHTNVFPAEFVAFEAVSLKRVQPPSKGIVITFDEFATIAMKERCNKLASLAAGMQRAADACGLIAEECGKLKYERNFRRTDMRTGFAIPGTYVRNVSCTLRARRRAVRQYKYLAYTRPRTYGSC